MIAFIDVGGSSPLWAAAFLVQVVLSYIKQIVKHEFARAVKHHIPRFLLYFFGYANSLVRGNAARRPAFEFLLEFLPLLSSVMEHSLDV